MDFSSALRLVKAGRSVRRKGWVPAATGWSLELAHPVVEGQAVSMLMVRYGDGMLRPFSGSNADLLAMDWEQTPSS
jgi:hypothetical protein